MRQHGQRDPGSTRVTGDDNPAISDVSQSLDFPRQYFCPSIERIVGSVAIEAYRRTSIPSGGLAAYEVRRCGWAGFIFAVGAGNPDKRAFGGDWTGINEARGAKEFGAGCQSGRTHQAQHDNQPKQDAITWANARAR